MLGLVSPRYFVYNISKKNVSHVTFCSCFFISSIVGRKIDKRDAYGIVYSLVMIDLLYFVAKMDQILT